MSFQTPPGGKNGEEKIFQDPPVGKSGEEKIFQDPPGGKSGEEEGQTYLLHMRIRMEISHEEEGSSSSWKKNSMRIRLLPEALPPLIVYIIILHIMRCVILYLRIS